MRNKIISLDLLDLSQYLEPMSDSMNLEYISGMIKQRLLQGELAGKEIDAVAKIIIKTIETAKNSANKFPDKSEGEIWGNISLAVLSGLIQVSSDSSDMSPNQVSSRLIRAFSKEAKELGKKEYIGPFINLFCRSISGVDNCEAYLVGLFNGINLIKTVDLFNALGKAVTSLGPKYIQLIVYKQAESGFSDRFEYLIKAVLSVSSSYKKDILAGYRLASVDSNTKKKMQAILLKLRLF